MKILSLLPAAFSLLSFTTVAQNNLVFQNVTQRIRIERPLNDSNFTYNFEYLNEQQLYDLGRNSYRLKQGSGADFQVFEDIDEYIMMENNRLLDRLIYREDSVDVEYFDDNGMGQPLKIAGMIDSTWYFDNYAGMEFKEDWIIDTLKFTMEIKSRLYGPMVYKKGKEEFGPVCLFYIKPGTTQTAFQHVTDFLITDVCPKQGSFTENQFYNNESNCTIDSYRQVLFINSTIDKVRSGKLRCYPPTVPFKSALSKKEVKTLFADEFTPNKNEKFAVRYKMYNYRFKLVEKWEFDPFTLAIKKQALGIMLMKRNEANDLNVNTDGNISYTFTPVVYVPFNQK